MKITTKHFGEIEIDDSKIVTFEEGVLGFEDEREFAFFYENEDAPNGLCWMQSVNSSELVLPVINPIFWFPDYSPEIEDEEIEKLGKLTEEDLQLFSVVVIREKIEDLTCNLQAPIIVNHETKRAAQLIAKGDKYSVRTNLYSQMQKAKEAGE